MSKAKKKKTSLYPIFLLFVLLLVGGGYSAYWFWMSGQLKAGAEDWVEDQRRAGMEMEYSEMTISGYPFRFVLETTDPVIASPYEGWRWEGEKLQLVAQSYNLYHIIAFAPGLNKVTLPDGEELTLTPAHKSAASMKFSSDWHLKEFRLSLPGLDASQNGDALLQLTGINLGLRPMPGSEENLQLAFSIERASLFDLARELEWLGPDMDEFVVWLEVENFYPLIENRLSPTEWRVDGNKMHIRRGEINWGPLDLATRASFTLDRDNQPDGTVGIILEKVEELKAGLKEAGLYSDEIQSVIGPVSLASANGKFTTVRVKDRKVSLLDAELTAY